MKSTTSIQHSLRSKGRLLTHILLILFLSLLVVSPNTYASKHKTNDKVTICHIPSSNPGNAHTISVAKSAVKAHMDHGDYKGQCPSKNSGTKGSSSGKSKGSSASSTNNKGSSKKKGSSKNKGSSKKKGSGSSSSGGSSSGGSSSTSSTPAVTPTIDYSEADAAVFTLSNGRAKSRSISVSVTGRVATSN